MGCFDNLISVDGLCGDVQSTSGYTLNQIGIDKTEIEAIITKGYTAQSFLDEKQNFAVKKVTSDIYSYMSPKYKADSILAGSRIGYPDTQKTLQTQSGYVGIRVNMNNYKSYVDFVIASFSLFTDFTGDIDVLIYDVDQGLLLDTVTVASIAGQVVNLYDKVTVPALRKDLNLWIGYDATGINSYLTQVHSGCSDCKGYTFTHRFVHASGSGISAPFTEGQLTSLTHTGGLSIGYSINCDHQNWLCDHSALLSQPILWQTGALICRHAILSAPNQRVMTNTILNIDLMKEKLTYFESEYDRTMRNILGNMRVPQDKDCFHCYDKIISVPTLA